MSEEGTDMSATVPPPPDLLTTPQVAEMLGVATPTIHRAVRLGQLKPAYRLPGAWLFRPDEVERYIQRRTEIEEARKRLNSAT
jgi:excisionase family DNA binding protein